MKLGEMILSVTMALVIGMLSASALIAADKEMVSLTHQARSTESSKAVPGQLNYQGYLADASDSSAIMATLPMTFRLFDTESGGSEAWSETHPAVEIGGGLFQVFLGSVTPFPDGLFDGTPLWLQTEVGPEILAPRRPLVSTAYSHRANSAEMLLDYTLNDLDDRWVNEGQSGSVTADMIADGEIVDDDIAPGAAIDPAKIDGTAWTADNDGTGSGLDADLLDGQQAAAFIGMTDLDHLDAADGNPANAVYVDTAGKVGIGTTSPLTELDVSGAVNATTYFGDGSNLTGVSGTSDGDWTISGSDLYANVPGNVGIGVTNPSAKLQVVDGSGNYAVISNGAYGVYGRNMGGDNYGYLGGSGYGVYGKHNASGHYGYLGGGSYGVYGYSSSPKGEGEIPTSTSGIYGEAQGTGASGVYGINTDSGHYGILGHPDYAGYFDGDVHVMGDVGIGVMPSAYPLNVSGMANMLEFRMPTGAADGAVLTSDATGVGTWQPGLWIDQGNFMEADIAPIFTVYRDSSMYIGLSFINDPKTAAITNWSNDGAAVLHCYNYQSQGDLYGMRAFASSDSNDIAVYGYGEEWGGYFGCGSGGTAVMGESGDTTRYGLLGTTAYGVYGQYGVDYWGYVGGNSYGTYGRSDSDYNQTAGAYGYHSSNVDGTGYYFTTTHCGALGRCLWGMDYHCGVQGTVYGDDSGVRVSGVHGHFSEYATNYWGSLAYKNSASNLYGGYFTSYTAGGGKGSPGSEVSSAVGLGAWGDLFGADIHGKVYGTYTEGETYGLYSHGMVVRDDLDVHLQPAKDRSMSVLYTNVSTDVTVQTSGYCQLSKGVCAVTFDENFRRVVSSDIPVVVTVTPIGGSQGVHLDRVGPDGFTVMENNAGKSDVQVAFIAIGRRAGYEDPDLPGEVVAADYVDKLANGLHNDADTITDGQGLYYQDGRLTVGQHASMLPHPDKSREPAEEARVQLPPKPRRIEEEDIAQDNRAR